MTKLIIGLEGHCLTDADRRRLVSEHVAGVILFSRNYQDPAQLQRLVAEIRNLRADLLITVDHEGGRVQRFRTGFSVLPKAAAFTAVFRKDPSRALELSFLTGQVLATELLAYGVDLSYAPVVDLDYGVSAVIGDRSFGVLPFEVAALAGASMAGMAKAGMRAVAKHFPGHGGVEVDTHGAIAVDERHYDFLAAADMVVFKALIDDGLAAIMPAHVIYPQIDALPAGFSAIWLQKILRQECRFNGAIISDDLDMLGAAAVGDLVARLHAACAAGCDLILLCNEFASIDLALQHMPVSDASVLVNARIEALRPQRRMTPDILLDPAFVQLQKRLQAFVETAA